MTWPRDEFLKSISSLSKAFFKSHHLELIAVEGLTEKKVF
jgi:hypothetical protein